jgi:hypothetical protein
MRRTATFYGLKLWGTMDPHVDCTEGKSKQQNMTKGAKGGSKIPGECLFMDISLIKKRSLGGSKYWLLVLDDCTD